MATTIAARPVLRDLALATPSTRDWYADALRVASIAVVVVGHWLMAVVVPDGAGGLTAGNALRSAPALPYLTWLLQVMPVFFVVGGFAHYTALRSPARRSYAEFVRARVIRLLRPTAVFVGLWLAAAVVLEATGRQRGIAALAVQTVAQPLWFVGVYLGVVGLAPAMLRWHDRQGRAVPIVLGAGAIGVDTVRFGLDVPAIGVLNVALVWLAVHQLGYLYADGTLLRGGRRVALGLAAGGLGAVVLLTVAGPYPVSMVGLPGDPVSNMNPPTVALLAHAVWLTGLVLLLRDRVTALLQRPRVWTVVVGANTVVMTVFLWHLTAAFAGYLGLVALGVPLPTPGTAVWWLTRPGWLAVLAAVTVALVGTYRWAERPVPNRTTPATPASRRVGGLAAVGVAACAVGVLGLSLAGFGGLLAGHAITLVVVPMTAPAALALAAAGAATLTLVRRS